MFTYITKIDLSGIKNINKDVSLKFYGKTIGKNINLENVNIKSIYGANGSGKSALVHALDIYENINRKKGFLFSEDAHLQLDELLNKETLTYKIQITFLCYEEDGEISGHFRHELLVKKKGEYYIHEESLFQILTRSEKIVARILDGKIVESILSDELTSKMINQLSKRSIVDIFREVLVDNIDNENEVKEQDSILIPFVQLGHSLVIKTEDTDKHDFYFFTKRREMKVNNIVKDRMISVNSLHSFRVNSTSIEDFRKHMKAMENFIKIFKKDLHRIYLEEKIDKTEIVVEPYFDYGKYKIHLEFESAGVKKLTELFELFTYREQGAIIIIDEFDANINDVYLMKLLEYFIQNPQGQLIFTTHNITPMQVLSKSKFAIDFITEDGEVTEWRKSGNYSPVKVYQNGLVKGLPFNIHSFDFIGVFDEGE